MELTHTFTVPATVDVAWAAFNDLERIAPCFPGAALSSYDGESFEGLCKVKLGPISLQYTGTGRFVERDEGSHRAVIEAKGKDKRGNGTAAATVTASLQASGGATTEVVVVTDLNVTGKPAQFGRGVMQDVSDKLLAQFAACLEDKLGAVEELSPSPQPEPEQAAGPDVEQTPIAEQAAAAVGVSSSRPSEPTSQSPRVAAGPQADELDLGATVLPVLIRRYAPYALGVLAAVWLLRRLLRRA